MHHKISTAGAQAENPPLQLHFGNSTKNSLSGYRQHLLLNCQGFDDYQQLIPSYPTVNNLPWAGHAGEPGAAGSI